jgi:hypothetical protein
MGTAILQKKKTISHARLTVLMRTVEFVAVYNVTVGLVKTVVRVLRTVDFVVCVLSYFFKNLRKNYPLSPGADCSQSCMHGLCSNSLCICETNWTGLACDIGMFTILVITTFNPV